ncbi:MAG: type II secretion system F family protein [Candidatus Micrarchaeota archaeon]|nr:type II secretion system F family protein [Candidatus Micrarchaeota archaeon]
MKNGKNDEKKKKPPQSPSRASILEFITRSSSSLLIESDLPIALRSLAAELAMGSPFERALERIAESGYFVSAEFSKAVKEVRAGSSVPDALSHVAHSTDSLILKRALMQLTYAYESGGDFEPVRRLAQELIEQQRAGAREHSAKTAFASVLVISSSCILPSLFLLYVLVGSSFLLLPVDSTGILLAYLVAFPLANALILAWVARRTPPSLGGRKAKLLDARDISYFDKWLASRGLPFTFKKSLAILLAVSLIISISLVSMGFDLIPSLLPLWLPLAAYVFFSYLAQARRDQLDRFLPDALFLASSFQKGVSMEHIVSAIADSGYGALSEEFAMARSQIAAGEDPARAIEEIGRRNDSILLSRATGLMAQGYRTGANVHLAMRETADDTFNVFSIIRERTSQLALQKYTLIAGGTIFVPLIIGSVASMSGQMDLGGLSELLGVAQDPALLPTAIFCSQAYLVIYSLMASVFISMQEQNPGRAAVYFLFMAPTALLIFYLSRSMNVLSMLS